MYNMPPIIELKLEYEEYRIEKCIILYFLLGYSLYLYHRLN